jgi:hypothetical protein
MIRIQSDLFPSPQMDCLTRSSRLRMARSYRCLFRGIGSIWGSVVSRGGSMELAVVVIALIVAGALIPDHSKIVFYR